MQNNKIIKNEYIYSLITRLFSIGINIVQSVLIARYLGAELKGTNAYISSVASVASIVVTFGVHQAYPYLRKKYGKDKIYTEYLSLISVYYGFLFIVGCVLCFIIDLNYIVRILLILVPIYGYSMVLDYVALIEMPNVRNRYSMIICIIDVIYVLFLYLFINRSLSISISILLIGNILRSIIFFVILKVKIFFCANQVTLFKELLSIGFFPMLALVMTTLNYRIDVIMLHHSSNITDAMIGVYSLGLSLSDKIALIPDTLQGILISKLAKGAPDSEVAKVSRFGLWSSIMIFVLIGLFGNSIISLLYGKEYEGAYLVIIITAFGMVAVSYFKFISQYNIIHRKQYLNVILLSIAIVIDIVLNILFIPIWGIEGAAISTSIGNFICGIVFVIYFCFKSGISIDKMILPQKSDLDILVESVKKKTGK